MVTRFKRFSVTFFAPWRLLAVNGLDPPSNEIWRGCHDKNADIGQGQSNDKRPITGTVAFVFASIIVLGLALCLPCSTHADRFTNGPSTLLTASCEPDSLAPVFNVEQRPRLRWSERIETRNTPKNGVEYLLMKQGCPYPMCAGER